LFGVGDAAEDGDAIGGATAGLAGGGVDGIGLGGEGENEVPTEHVVVSI
jgi:hypothetical protein